MGTWERKQEKKTSWTPGHQTQMYRLTENYDTHFGVSFAKGSYTHCEDRTLSKYMQELQQKTRKISWPVTALSLSSWQFISLLKVVESFFMLFHTSRRLQMKSSSKLTFASANQQKVFCVSHFFSQQGYNWNLKR